VIWRSNRIYALFQILHEEDCIPALIIKQIVHQVAGHKNSEASGTLPLFGANLDVPNWRIRRIRNRRMWQKLQRKTGTWVVNMYDHRAGGPKEGNPHALVRVRFTAMLNGIHQQLAKRGGYVFAYLGRQIGLH